MVIIDRFEGNTAVLEADGVMIEVPRAQLPASAREGDVLVKSGGGWVTDSAATSERRSAVSKKMRRLIRKND